MKTLLQLLTRNLQIFIFTSIFVFKKKSTCRKTGEESSVSGLCSVGVRVGALVPGHEGVRRRPGGPGQAGGARGGGQRPAVPAGPGPGGGGAGPGGAASRGAGGERVLLPQQRRGRRRRRGGIHERQQERPLRSHGELQRRPAAPEEGEPDPQGVRGQDGALRGLAAERRREGEVLHRPAQLLRPGDGHVAAGAAHGRHEGRQALQVPAAAADADAPPPGPAQPGPGLPLRREGRHGDPDGAPDGQHHVLHAGADGRLLALAGRAAEEPAGGSARLPPGLRRHRGLFRGALRGAGLPGRPEGGGGGELSGGGGELSVGGGEPQRVEVPDRRGAAGRRHLRLPRRAGKRQRQEPGGGLRLPVQAPPRRRRAGEPRPRHRRLRGRQRGPLQRRRRQPQGRGLAAGRRLERAAARGDGDLRGEAAVRHAHRPRGEPLHRHLGAHLQPLHLR